jgi:hypothetical protein
MLNLTKGKEKLMSQFQHDPRLDSGRAALIEQIKERDLRIKELEEQIKNLPKEENPPQGEIEDEHESCPECSEGKLILKFVGVLSVIHVLIGFVTKFLSHHPYFSSTPEMLLP